MSLSLHERISLSLAPERAVWLRLSRGLRPRLVERAVAACPPAEQGPAWRPALAALRDLLQEQRLPPRATTLVLSNHFVRYQLIPWREGLDTPEEWQALVQHAFQQVYGDAAAQWLYRWSGSGYGGPLLASAIDSELLQEAAALAQEAGLRLASVQPYLMAACNHWRGQIKVGRGAFLLAEPGRVGLACFDERGWSDLVFEPLDGDIATALPAVLPRMLLRLQRSPLPLDVYAFAGDGSAVVWPEPQTLRLRPLALPSALAALSIPDRAACSMALLGD